MAANDKDHAAYCRHQFPFGLAHNANCAFHQAILPWPVLYALSLLRFMAPVQRILRHPPAGVHRLGREHTPTLAMSLYG